jgi:rare lipoprotein A
MRRSFLLGAAALSLTATPTATAAVTVLSESLAAQGPLLASASSAPIQVAVRDMDVAPAAEPLPQPVAPPVRLAPVRTPAPRVASVSQGTASWYGPGFFGNRTANGEMFRPGTLTAAHRTLPFGTRVRVTNLNNGRSTIVRINDRGPFHGSRVIDLAHGAAHALGVASSGLAPVRLEVLR